MAASQCAMEKEYEKNPKIKPDDIELFRTWLNSQPHLPSDKITDLDLILAYHCCERSSEVSKQVLDLNFTLRTIFPFLHNRHIDKGLEVAFHTCLMAPLKGCTVNGNRILFFTILDGDPKNFVYSDVIKQFTMIMDLWQYTDGTFHGLAIIIDVGNTSIGNIPKFEASPVQQVLSFLQEAMFIKLKEFHFINAPSFMDKVLGILRPFMSEKLLEMSKVHQTNSETLFNFMDKSLLPKEMGGQYKDYQTLRDEVWSNIKLNEKYFLEVSKKRVEETKRPLTSPNIISSILGVHGTFKKLEID